MKRWICCAVWLISGGVGPMAQAGDVARVTAHVISRVGPSYAPKRGDRVALVLPDSASEEDPALAALLADQLTRDGFHSVDRPENARWVLQAHYLLLSRPTLNAPSSADEPQVVEEKEADLRLTLYSVTEYINGERTAVWTSTSYAKPELYQQHPRSLLHLLLQNFGSDFEGDLHTIDIDAQTIPSKPATTAPEPPPPAQALPSEPPSASPDDSEIPAPVESEQMTPPG